MDNLKPHRARETDPELEYEELGKNLRYYSALRLGQLTVFFLVTWGLLFFLYGDPAPVSVPKQVLLKILGMMAAIAFFLMEENASDAWIQFRRRAVQLEERLGFQQYGGEPDKQLYAGFPYNRMPPGMRDLLSRRFTAQRAIRWMFRLVILFWIFSMIRP
jgi:hypothetical protein